MFAQLYGFKRLILLSKQLLFYAVMLDKNNLRGRLNKFPDFFSYGHFY